MIWQRSFAGLVARRAAGCQAVAAVLGGGQVPHGTAGGSWVSEVGLGPSELWTVEHASTCERPAGPRWGRSAGPCASGSRGFRRRSSSAAPGRRSSPPPAGVVQRTISLIDGTKPGLMLRRRRPMPNSGRKQRGRPAISPHSVTGLPCSLQARMTWCSSRSMAGLNGSHRWATLGLSRSAAIRYWIRSLEPMLTKSTSSQQVVDAQGRRRHLQHDAQRACPRRTARPARCSASRGPLDHALEPLHLLQRADHREQQADLCRSGRPAGWPAAASGRTPGRPS